MVQPVMRQDDVNASLRELSGVLDKGLTPESNLSGFLWEGQILAGEELKIRNRLRDGKIPTRFIVLDITPSHTIGKGVTPWDIDYIYLRNAALATTVTAKVFFYKDR